eukprot:4264577-Prymnesium_polylepis.2
MAAALPLLPRWAHSRTRPDGAALRTGQVFHASAVARSKSWLRARALGLWRLSRARCALKPAAAEARGRVGVAMAERTRRGLKEAREQPRGVAKTEGVVCGDGRAASVVVEEGAVRELQEEDVASQAAAATRRRRGVVVAAADVRSRARSVTRARSLSRVAPTHVHPPACSPVLPQRAARHHRFQQAVDERASRRPRRLDGAQVGAKRRRLVHEHR